MTTPNIIGVDIEAHSILWNIAMRVYEIVRKNYDEQNNIEIEFKYAEFVNFCSSYFVEGLKGFNELNNRHFQQIEKYVFEQSELHMQTLKTLSHQRITHLNPLGRRIYQLVSQFHEQVHQRFYAIRDFFIELCTLNQLNSENQQSIYREIQKYALNSTLVITNKEQLRLDIILKEGQISGRYSYEVEKGWTKVLKESLLKEEYDLMVKQRTFRLGVKKEQQSQMQFFQVADIFNEVRNAQKVMIRLKKAIRVEKNREVEFSLSEVYQPDSQFVSQYFEDIKDSVTLGPQVLDTFCKNTFQRFYHPQNFRTGQSKHEIQCQFTKKAVKEFSTANRDMVFRKVQNAFSDLVSLWYAPHKVKKQESSILKRQSKPSSDDPIQCRLENEFGSYMHDHIVQLTNEQ